MNNSTIQVTFKGIPRTSEVAVVNKFMPYIFVHFNDTCDQ